VGKAELLKIARGEQPADLLLRNGRIVNVFSGEIEDADIAIAEDRIAGIGAGYSAANVVDLNGSFVAPGLIDAHVHIESSLCVPSQFTAAILPRGITTIIADPHEIANVIGLAGVRFMSESSRGLPLNVVLMAPSCVPATHMETNGATLDAQDLADLLSEGVVHGLAEMMNVPGAVLGAPDVLAKINVFCGRPVDGHAPALSGLMLNAYAATGVGSEHECTTVEEAAEKLARGFYILIREATNAHNLHTLLPLITEKNSRRICFCTDDRVPGDLLDQGSVDFMVREAIAFGIDPITAIRMATLNPAEWFGLHGRGAVAPGRVADLIIFEDLNKPTARQVYAEGRLVAEENHLVGSINSAYAIPADVRSTMKVDWDRFNLQIPASRERVRVIVSLPNQIITEERIVNAPVRDGQIVADPGQDLLKMAVVDRHKASGAVGLGLIAGIGLRRGAIAGTVAHDHHNLVIIGADDTSMTTAAHAIGEMGGGLVVAEGSEILAALPLPVAGLMSDRPIIEVRGGYDQILAAAAHLGSPLHDPFMAMSFMALEVIPELKLTDQGLVDVEKFEIVDLFDSDDA
jgi:adenine deaminase